MSEPHPQPLLRAWPGAGSAMSAGERRACGALAGIFALRMLGLFMIFPIFSLAADGYAGNTAMLTGLAIGIYGLTQALFQVPFGRLSDRIGRKTVIAGGLLLFAAGSVVAATADTIWGVIVGRALQGSGAVAAAILALTADLTREEQRTKAMAIVGASIGVAFALAIVAGPALAPILGLSGLFWATAILALLGIAVLLVYVPTPARTRFHRETEVATREIYPMLRDTQLLRLDFGIFTLHLIITAAFVVLPLALRDYAGFAVDRHWLVYLLVFAAALLLILPCIRYVDRRDATKPIFQGAILTLLVSLAALGGLDHGPWLLVALLVVFFASFTLLESTLPSLVSRMAPTHLKGTAFGVYSTAQYVGAFVGGVAGGWLYGALGIASVFGFCALLCVAWLAVSMGMRAPRPTSTCLVNVGEVDARTAAGIGERLRRVAGVTDAVVVPDDGVAYLKVEPRRLDRAALEGFSSRRG